MRGILRADGGLDGRREEKTMNIFNLSFGKDSMATLILAAEQGVPIDRVMYCDIRFNDEIGAEPIEKEK